MQCPYLSLRSTFPFSLIGAVRPLGDCRRRLPPPDQSGAEIITVNPLICLLVCSQHFPFSLIDAMGPLDDCRRQINRELRYQSSMDLDEHTYAAIR